MTEEIFEHTDSDGDKLVVRQGRTNSGHLYVDTNNGGGRITCVRLTREDAKRLNHALTVWLDGHQLPERPQREARMAVANPPLTAGRPDRASAPEVAPEFIRRAALDAALTHQSYSGQAGYSNVLDVAEEFAQWIATGERTGTCGCEQWRPAREDTP